MTVVENLEMGAYARRANRTSIKADFDRVFQLLPRLAEPPRAYVLESGKVVRTADAGTLLNDDSVRAAYLGGDVGQ
jgi:ABC-type branched-subunit amino acid transport system ATPase component